MAQITLLDYILLPFYLWIIYKIAYYYRDKFYPENHEYRQYFIPALTAKIAGAIFIGLIYNYYYGGGDTLNYFYHVQIINSTFFESPATWLRLITHTADETNIIDARALADMYWYDNYTTGYVTIIIGAIVGVFCFTKYLPINIVIASIAFIGMWLMFITFAAQYKKITKYIAIAILFMPGVIVWGSGLFKDTFCMFSIGCLVYTSDMFFERKVLKISLILLSVLSIALLILIKAYIFIILLPALTIKIFLNYKKRAKYNPQKKSSYYITLVAIYLLTFLILGVFGSKIATYTTQNILETIVVQKNWLLSQSSNEGSSYDLGDFSPSFGSIAQKFFPAVNVTLFRPYLWESRSAIQIFNALESSAVMLLTLYLLFTKNIFKTLNRIYRDPNMIMCIFFTCFFGFLVGISSYNFGTLSRYKIPCTPFYIFFLMVLIFNDKNKPTIIEA